MQVVAKSRSNLAQSHLSKCWQKKRESGKIFYDLVFKWSGRQDSNLRPSVPKALTQLATFLSVSL